MDKHFIVFITILNRTAITCIRAFKYCYPTPSIFLLQTAQCMCSILQRRIHAVLEPAGANSLLPGLRKEKNIVI